MGKYSGLNLDETTYVEFVNHLEHYEVEERTPWLKLINNFLNSVQNDKYDCKYVIYDDANDDDCERCQHYYEVAKIIKGLGDKYFIDRVQDEENYSCYEGDITECKCLVLNLGLFDTWEDVLKVYLDLISGE